MSGSKTSTWVGGATLLAVVILAFGWFFAISPALAEASDSREQTEEVRNQNSILAAKNRDLAEKFEHLDDYKAELGEFRVGIAESIDQEGFNTELSELSEKTGAFVVDISFSTSLEVDPETTAPAGLFAVPVAVTVLGSPEQTVDYIDDLQQKISRNFLISSVALEGQSESGASGGKPETRDGDAEIVISGYIYVMNPDAASSTDSPGVDDPSENTEDPVAN